MIKSLTPHTPLNPRQKQLARQLLFDELTGSLWVDARQLEPQIGAIEIPSWDQMMFGHHSPFAYPSHWRVLEWPHHPARQRWQKPIANWIIESCALFPSHQLTLLHAVAKYPILLDLLDQAPVLAWQLVQQTTDEAELHALLQQKQIHLAQQIGWPASKETINLLKKLRLRFVNAELHQNIETCLLDDHRRQQLQHLPRINSMALTLAARFPELINSRLHQTLAQLPCRPMQCQAMIALLEDAYFLASHVTNAKTASQQIGQQRYLTDVETLTQQWFQQLYPTGDNEKEALSLSEPPQRLTTPEQWQQLSHLTQHPWAHYPLNTPNTQLWAANIDQSPVALLLQKTKQGWQIQKIRTAHNQLPNAQQLTACNLWLTQHTSS